MSLRFKKFFVVLAGVSLLVGGAVTPIARAVDQTYLEQQSEASVTSEFKLNCGMGSYLTAGAAGGNIPDCIPVVIYYVIYKPVMVALTLAGGIFDFMMALSIDRGFIKQDFVNTAWETVRDFSNMIFIFILLYTGIQTIFGAKWQGTVSKVVVVALIVNFSMFFTNVVIDAGNVLAVGVYSGMGVEKTEAIDRSHKTTGLKERNLSATLVNAFAPQSFMKPEMANRDYASTIFLIAAFVSGWVAWIFFKAAFLFMGRIIAFWFLLIISPFALVSMTLPSGKWNIWGWWTSTLIDQAFVAPVFLFLVYIIMKAVEGGGGGILAKLGTPASGSFVFDAIFVPIVIAGMLVYALKYALKVATSMSGEFGKIGANLGNQVLGVAGVVATGGASTALGGGAAALRATLGQNAQKVIGTGVLQQKATAGGFGGFVARQRLTLAEKTAAGSFDIRETGIAQKGIKAAGVDVGKVSKEAQGGWVGVQKKREKDDKARAEKYEVTDAEKAAKAVRINPEYSAAKARVEKEYQEERAAVLSHENAKIAASNTDEGKAVKKADVANLTAKEQRDVAQERLKNSDAGRRVEGAEKNLKTMGSTAKLEGDRLTKTIEKLKKDQAEAEKNLAFDTVERIKGEIGQAENAQKLAQGAVKNAERELEDAKKELAESAEGEALTEAEAAVKKAQKDLEDAQKALDATDAGKILDATKKTLENKTAALKVTREVINKTEKELDEWKNTENERRREQIGYVITSTRYYVSNKDREAAVKKIRAEKDKEKRKTEKAEKDTMKMLKKAIEDMNKSEEKKEEKKEGEGENK